ncbi:MAG: hypothetical protein HYY85_18420 [Deltaproteobacteria bacterium]|nr:hypothetical protein [Deltaproteobacteria bacterium]
MNTRPHARPRWPSGPVIGGLVALLLLGGAGFLEGLAAEPSRAWPVYLVNFLFWAGLAQAGVTFAALHQITGSRWGPAVRRLAEGMGAFLPAALLLFLPLVPGRAWLFPWLQEPLPQKAWWLDAPRLFLRDGGGLILLTWVSLLFVRYSLRPELGEAIAQGQLPPRGLAAWLANGWQGLAAERARSRRALSVLAPAVLLIYCLVWSLLGFDLVMSLSPAWSSTLFGAYIFLTTFYLGLAGLAVLAVLLRKPCGLLGHVASAQLHDLGKLLLGFCMLTGYFFFSQYLVIWYGNLPREYGFFLVRGEGAWGPLAWTVLGLVVFLPFVVLLSRRAKERPGSLLALTLVIVVGMWLERYVLVVPSLAPARGPAFGWVELSTTLGFLAAAALSYAGFVRILPPGALVPEPGREALPPDRAC